MRALVEYIATSLVDDPASVHVRDVARPRETRLELRVSPQEIGKVIGRHGRTARAIRSLLEVCGRKVGKRFSLEIAE